MKADRRHDMYTRRKRVDMRLLARLLEWKHQGTREEESGQETAN